MLDKLDRCHYSTVFDLASDFHQMEMAKEDIQKTACNVVIVCYGYVKILFGLKNTFAVTIPDILTPSRNRVENSR